MRKPGRPLSVNDDGDDDGDDDDNDDGDDDDVGGDDNGDEENDDYDHLRGEGSHRASSQVLGNCCETWWQ